ncbi:hypothetical protein [Microlunatus sp. GCM10028923]|uniref:hypothetical protein n=1 Tax=Microlunatus sp. GCM10028923 TaxID=3273400 RepID=UPI00361373E8
MNLVLDAGALIAVDRADRRIAGLILLGRRAGADVITTAPVVGQVWRHGSRQVRLAQFLARVDVREVGLDDAKAAGALLGRAGSSDVVDALVAMLTRPGDQLLTSEPDDLARLTGVRDGEVSTVTV